MTVNNVLQATTAGVIWFEMSLLMIRWFWRAMFSCYNGLCWEQIQIHKRQRNMVTGCKQPMTLSLGKTSNKQEHVWMKRSLQSNASSVIVIIKRSREPLSLATAEAPPTSLWKQVQPISMCSEPLWKPALCSCVKAADVYPIWSQQSQQYVSVCSRRGPEVAINSRLLGTRDCFEVLGKGLSF